MSPFGLTASATIGPLCWAGSVLISLPSAILICLILLSARPTKTLWLSALKATACGAAGIGSLCSALASAAFHSVTVLSALAAATVALLGLMATLTIGNVGPAKSLSLAPLVRFHRRTILSLPPVSILPASAVKTRLVIASGCVNSFGAISGNAQSLTLPSSDAESICVLVGLMLSAVTGAV